MKDAGSRDELLDCERGRRVVLRLRVKADIAGKRGVFAGEAAACYRLEQLKH